MPDFVSHGGKWQQLPNPHQVKKEEREKQLEVARKPKVFPTEIKKEVIKEKVIEKVVSKAKIQVKPSKKSSIFTPTKKKGK